MEAEKAIPDTVPRPRLHTAHEWTDADHAYRAELYERIQGTSLSDGPLPPHGLQLPGSWWTSLRTSLTAIASTGTDRVAVRQERLDWAMPEFLGTALDTRVPAWTTAHADIQWSNLTGPDLIVLDWERWGLAPAGYDEATLYISSLTHPRAGRPRPPGVRAGTGLARRPLLATGHGQRIPSRDAARQQPGVGRPPASPSRPAPRLSEPRYRPG